MYSNNPIVIQLLSLLKQFGIHRVVISPGGRHVQLVLSLEQDKDFELYSVVDERSAAFFALGLIQAYNEPVAVACSSGTACMNYGSAIAEAYYQKLPLLVLSADRLPALLNQGEEQMYNQLDPFRTITKYQVQLPEVQDEIDLWHCNRLINEALIELTNHGYGPVHINFPMRDIFGKGFDVEILPKVRKISIQYPYDDLSVSARSLSGKKILIVWGQSVNNPTKVMESIAGFVEKTGAVVISDCISNCPYDEAIKNTFVLLQTLSSRQKAEVMPDVVISLGGNQVFNSELKALLKGHDFVHWQVGCENKVCDPYHVLTEIFEMPEYVFFDRITYDLKRQSAERSYNDIWKEMSDKITLPTDTRFNEVYAIGSLLQRLPAKCNLQLANSNTIRIASYFPIPDSVEVHCNRGVNGIDGSMSTAIGFASAKKDLTFYVTGELSFFYDMNSLWIKHLSPNLRILLINNDGGAFMYSQRRIVNGKPSLTLAANNHVSAKGWAESTGFKYLHADSKQSLDSHLNEFLEAKSDKPILLEVDTRMSEDRVATDEYIYSLDKRTLMDKVQGRLEHSKFNIFKK